MLVLFQHADLALINNLCAIPSHFESVNPSKYDFNLPCSFISWQFCKAISQTLHLIPRWDGQLDIRVPNLQHICGHFENTIGTSHRSYKYTLYIQVHFRCSKLTINYKKRYLILPNSLICHIDGDKLIASTVIPYLQQP